MKKCGLVFVIAGLIMLAGAAFLSLSINKPITDPNDPRFNPMEFRFENYKETENTKKVCRKKENSTVQLCRTELDDVMDKMFPPGTKKEYVDKILITQAGAWTRPYKNELFYNYKAGTGWIVTTVWTIGITYNQKNEVTKVGVSVGYSAL